MVVTPVPDAEAVLPPYLDAEAGWLSLLSHCALPPSSAENIGTDLGFAPWLFLQDTKQETQNTSIYLKQQQHGFKKISHLTLDWTKEHQGGKAQITDKKDVTAIDGTAQTITRSRHKSWGYSPSNRGLP